jgi:tRNA(Ile)-lysidine synthase
MNIEAAIREFTLRHPAGGRKLVAVSGGRDSVVLLHALHAAGHHRLVVCHLNHRLRGRASTGDAAFVRRLAAILRLPCEISEADVKAEAAASGDSLETAGRRARHRVFAECARIHRCRTLLMAHHADDDAETVLFNLFRGASGLRGMMPETDLVVPGVRRPLRVVRPLLEVSRAEIDEWCAVHGTKFREDATNAGTDPVRNRIRLELLPAICKAMGRDVRPALLRAARIAAEESALLDALAAPHAEAAELDTASLSSLPRALQRRVIHLWLRRHRFTGIGFHEVEAVRSMLDANGPAGVNLPGNRFVRRKHGKLN